MGCQDLLEEVPGRSRKDQTVFSSPTDAKSWYKLKPSSSKSYSIKDETSSKFFKEDFYSDQIMNCDLYYGRTHAAHQDLSSPCAKCVNLSHHTCESAHAMSQLILLTDWQ